MVQPYSIGWMFQTPATISEAEQTQLDTLFEALDDQDDVDDVASNLQ